MVQVPSLKGKQLHLEMDGTGRLFSRFLLVRGIFGRFSGANWLLVLGSVSRSSTQ